MALQWGDTDGDGNGILGGRMYSVYLKAHLEHKSRSKKLGQLFTRLDEAGACFGLLNAVEAEYQRAMGNANGLWNLVMRCEADMRTKAELG